MAVTLTQTQIIQSLGEALSWFERELSWGVKAADLPHLTGRIGELYAAMITRGQMALDTNQHGYDVVSAEGARISVKTVTTSSHALFNPATLANVDRVIVLRLNVDEDTGLSIEELMDLPLAQARAQLGPAGDKLRFSTRAPRNPTTPPRALKLTDQAVFQNITLSRFENGHIRVERDQSPVLPAKPELRRIAGLLGIATETETGRVRTTHELGSLVIRALSES